MGVTILLADDHSVVRQGLRMFLALDPELEVVGEAGNGQEAFRLAKELTPLSLPDIGEAFGGRDHTTVLHACRKVAELRSTNSDITRDFNSLLQVLRN